MTFKKNLLVVLITTGFICVVAYLTGMARDVLVYGLFIWVGGSVVSLATEDLFRKFAHDRDKITASYMFGFLLVLCSVIAFLWSIGLSDTMEFFASLALAVFFGGLGGVVFKFLYKSSICSDEDKHVRAEGKYERRWAKAYKKLAKAKEPKKVIYKALRYRLVGDSLDGSLDFNHPLAEFNDRCLTIAEVSMFKDDPTAIDVKECAVRYVDSLLKEVE